MSHVVRVVKLDLRGKEPKVLLYAVNRAGRRVLCGSLRGAGVLQGLPEAIDGAKAPQGGTPANTTGR